LSLRLSISPDAGHVLFANDTSQTFALYRDALSLSASGRTEQIPMFPKVFPPERPQQLEPGSSRTWKLLVSGNEIFPYGIERGGIRLLDKEHKVKAVYQHPSTGRLESDEVVYRCQKKQSDQPQEKSAAKSDSEWNQDVSQ
jgi:hypothetical protein